MFALAQPCGTRGLGLRKLKPAACSSSTQARAGPPPRPDAWMFRCCRMDQEACTDPTNLDWVGNQWPADCPVPHPRAGRVRRPRVLNLPRLAQRRRSGFYQAGAANRVLTRVRRVRQ